MNKHRGRNVDEYLKERGIFEEVAQLAQKRWEALQAEEADNAHKLPDNQTRDAALLTETYPLESSQR